MEADRKDHTAAVKTGSDHDVYHECRQPNMPIDIQARMRQAHSTGSERWAKVFNIREMAKMMELLTSGNNGE